MRDWPETGFESPKPTSGPRRCPWFNFQIARHSTATAEGDWRVAGKPDYFMCPPLRSLQTGTDPTATVRLLGTSVGNTRHVSQLPLSQIYVAVQPPSMSV